MYNWLVSLPGVGVKIAHCVMMYSLGRDVLPVDRHVNRILQRLDVVPYGEPPENVGKMIQDIIPKGTAHSLHVNLVVHGRRKCRVDTPKCDSCDIEALCAYAGHHVLIGSK